MHNIVGLTSYFVAAASVGLMLATWKVAKPCEIFLDVIFFITFGIIWIKVTPLIVLAFLYYTGRNFMTANNRI